MGAGCIKDTVLVAAATPVIFVVGTAAALGAVTATTLRGARTLVGSDAGKGSMNDKGFRDRMIHETNARHAHVKEKEMIEREWNRKQSLRGEIETDDVEAMDRARHRRESLKEERRVATRKCQRCGESGPGPFPGTCMCPSKCHSCGFFGPPGQCHCLRVEARQKHRYDQGAAVPSGRLGPHSSTLDRAHSGLYSSRSMELQALQMAPPPPPVVNFARAGSLGKLSSSNYKQDIGFGGIGDQLEAALGKPRIVLHGKLA